MSDSYTFTRGSSPLLVSVPHDGRALPARMRETMTPEGLALPDTDWHVARLYDFASGLGASVIVATYSRYVVDLNRSATDDVLYPGQVATGLCPAQTFAGDNIYRQAAVVGEQEKRQRVEAYWQPYHDCIAAELQRLKAEHGHAVLWDAHSIPSRVPRLFDGELPELNLGTFDGRSCATSLRQTLARLVAESEHSSVLDGRFKGGYITRHYGAPADGIHAVQLEIAQRAYMNETNGAWEESNACRLQETLRKMLAACTIQHGFT